MSDYIFHLVVRKGPRPGQIFPLTLETITLGRDPMSDIVVNDPELSRHHARLIYTGSGYQVQDMGSTNGTFVDGNRLAGETVALNPGQTIALGSNVALLYQMAENANDPMATMVAPMDATMIGLPDLPSFDEPLPAKVVPAANVDPEPALPSFDAGEDLPSFDAPADLPSFDTPADLPSFDAPADLPSFDDDPLPSFDQPLPSSRSSYEPIMAEPAFGSSAPDPVYSQTPPPAGGNKVNTGEKKNNTTRNIIIGVVVLLLLCCCCTIISYQFGADALLQTLCSDPANAASLADLCLPYQ